MTTQEKLALLRARDLCLMLRARGLLDVDGFQVDTVLELAEEALGLRSDQAQTSVCFDVTIEEVGEFAERGAKVGALTVHGPLDLSALPEKSAAWLVVRRS